VKAAIYPGSGDRPQVEEVDLLSRLGPRDVRVKIEATGVCHSDLSGLRGAYGELEPCIMGHEAAGTVVAAGPLASRVHVGDTVISSFVPVCGECFYCVRGQTNLCETMTSVRGGPKRATRKDGTPLSGYSCLGTFAEEMIVSEASVVAVHTGLPMAQLALIGCGVTTGVCAVLNTARVEPGSSVAVIGCGAVGTSAVQGARIAGATQIFAVDPVNFKRASALQVGATQPIDPADGDPVEQLRAATGGRGPDYVLEAVGLPETVQQAHAATRLGGTTVLIGAGLPGAVATFSVFDLHREKRLLGCSFGSAQVRRDIPRLVGLAESGSLDLAALVTRTMSLTEVNEAFRAMEAGEVLRSVLV
jgi:S-(hydroxymethyl)glutathione dehydrogenase / alcohol dehydrogenase